MSGSDFNLLSSINQIKDEQQTVLLHLDEIRASADQNVLPALEEIRLSALSTVAELEAFAGSIDTDSEIM